MARRPEHLVILIIIEVTLCLGAGPPSWFEVTLGPCPAIRAAVRERSRTGVTSQTERGSRTTQGAFLPGPRASGHERRDLRTLSDSGYPIGRGRDKALGGR